MLSIDCATRATCIESRTRPSVGTRSSARYERSPAVSVTTDDGSRPRPVDSPAPGVVPCAHARPARPSHRVRLDPPRRHRRGLPRGREVGDRPRAPGAHLLLVRRRGRPAAGAQPRGAGGLLPASRHRGDQRGGVRGQPGGHRRRGRGAPARPPPRLLLAVRPAAPRDPPDRGAQAGAQGRALRLPPRLRPGPAGGRERPRDPAQPAAGAGPRGGRSPRPASRSWRTTTTSPGSASASRPTASPTSSRPPSRRPCRRSVTS